MNTISHYPSLSMHIISPFVYCWNMFLDILRKKYYQNIAQVFSRHDITFLQNKLLLTEILYASFTCFVVDQTFLSEISGATRHTFLTSYQKRKNLQNFRLNPIKLYGKLIISFE